MVIRRGDLSLVSPKRVVNPRMVMANSHPWHQDSDMELNAHVLSHIMRKSAICICENKGVDKSNCAADQCLWFCYIDSAIPLLFSSTAQSAKELL